MSSITVASNDSKRPASALQDEEEHQQQQQQQQQRQEAAAAAAPPQPPPFGHQDQSTPTAPPQPKRRRVADSARVRAARACQRCRRLKEKCDGRQPCQRCYRSGRDCEFAPVGVSAGGGAGGGNGGGAAAAIAASVGGETVANKTNGTATTSKSTQHRSTKSEASNVREASLVVAENARTEERTKCLERLVQHLLGDVPLDLNNLRRMADKAGRRSESEAGSTTMGNEELDDLTLEDENFTVKTLSQSTAHYSGEFSHWNFSQKLRRRLSQCLDSDLTIPSVKRDLRNATSGALQSTAGGRGGTVANRAGMRILEYWRATQLQSPKTLVQSVLTCLPPRAVANFLVRIYFQFAQVNCFYVEEAWLCKKLDFMYEAPGHVTSEDSAWVCSVLMVLGIGTQFAHMAAGPPQDDGEDGNECEKPPLIPITGSDSDVGVTFYQMASKLIPDIITIASMESVQACLLLAHYALPLDTQGLAYTYLGLGIKMAIQNGMHRRYTGSDLDTWTIETRNRLWWTAYTVERRVSILHGRPTSIAATEVDAELPKDLADFRQHGDPAKFGNMSALIDMTMRLGDVANAITLLRRCPKNLQPTYFERIVDICQGLRAWWSTLSPEVQNPTCDSPLFRSSAHLKLCLYLNDIFVGRPFIFSQSTGSATSPGSMSSPGVIRRPDGGNSKSGDSPATAGTVTATATNSNNQQDAHNSQPPRPRINRAALVERAVEAAMNAVILLRTLHETTGLARSSYTEFSSCRAALLVMLAQSVNGLPQTPELKAAIDLGMQLIRRMAAGNVSTQSETSVIEALEIAVRRLHEMMQAQQQDPAALMAHTRAGGVGRGDDGDGEGEEGAEREGGQEGEGDAGKSGYERFREWASLWPVGGNGSVDPSSSYPQQSQQNGGGLSAAVGKNSSNNLSAAFAVPQGLGTLGWQVPPGATGMGGAEHSPESARWLSLMDSTGMGIGVEQLDDLGLFGGFPELGALDGWPGLS